MLNYRGSVPPSLRQALALCRAHFGAVALFSALINILYLAPTIYMMQVYDRVVPTSGVFTLVWITLVVAGAIATLVALDAVRTRLMIRVSARLDRLLAKPILDRLLARRQSGAVVTTQAMREFDTLRSALGGPAMVAVFDAPWTPLYLLVAFLIHPALALLVAAGGAVLVLLALLNERASRERNARAHQATSSAYASHESLARRGDVVAALGMRRRMVDRELAARQKGVRLSSSAQFTSGRYNALVKFVRMALQSLALGLAAWLAIERQISVGAIIAGSVLLARALQPIEQLVGGWAQVVAARQALATLSDLFRSDDAQGDRMALSPPAGALAVENVSLALPGRESPVVQDVSFRIAPGEIVGLIGPSGAGKSTIARIVAGAVPQGSGTVRLDGFATTDWCPEELARHIGYMPQEPVLFPGSVAENISRFAAGKGDETIAIARAVIAAAIAAGVHEVIQRLPAGYDTRVGDAGHGLSVGQAQRLCLARALYANPALLVLDEPNAALDGDGEAALDAALMQAKARKAAVLIVAHRPSALARADRLVVVRDGSIEREGPRAEILNQVSGQRTAATVVSFKGA